MQLNAYEYCQKANKLAPPLQIKPGLPSENRVLSFTLAYHKYMVTTSKCLRIN